MTFQLKSSVSSYFSTLFVWILAFHTAAQAGQGHSKLDLKSILDIIDTDGPSSFDFQVKPCSHSSIDLANPPIGLKCKTSQGSIVERVSQPNFGIAWKAPDNTIWAIWVNSSSLLPSEFDFLTAHEECEKIGGKIPTFAQFDQASRYGMGEVLLGAMGVSFWASEPIATEINSEPKHNFYTFERQPSQDLHFPTRSEELGVSDLDDWEFLNWKLPVICVGR
jgi:hypothetical protein